MALNQLCPGRMMRLLQICSAAVFSHSIAGNRSSFVSAHQTLSHFEFVANLFSVGKISILLVIVKTLANYAPVENGDSPGEVQLCVWRDREYYYIFE